MVQWLSPLHNFIQLSLNSGSAQVQILWRIKDSRWWGSLAMLLAGNKTKHISTVNYAIKTIHHHHHHHHHHHCLFKVIDNFEWFWMQDLQGFSSLEFDWSSLEFKIQFLVLHIFYYTLMTFLMMLYVILLSMLLILLSTLSVIGHLICGNN